MRLTTGLAAIVLVLGLMADLAGTAQARMIEHAMGQTEAPESPRRVVVLTNEGTEALLALGIKPVGAVRSWLGNPWYAHIAPDMEGVVDLGTEHAPNIEMIAALQPDLIIGNRSRQENIYRQLALIGPTVFSESLRGNWRKNFALYSAALGLREEGKAILEAFATRTGNIAHQLGSRRDERISLVRFMSSGARIYYNDTFAGDILEEIGFRRPPAQDQPGFADNVTRERIPEMDGDRLFYYVYNPEEAGDAALKAENEWTSEPLWQSLQVVQAGKVHRVSDAIWNTSGGVIAANWMLDDIERIFRLR